MTEPLKNRSGVISHEDRLRLLDDALARSVPDSRMWERQILPAMSGFRVESTNYIRVSSPMRPQGQWLVVQLRHDWDIQVEYHIANERGSPFESFFILPAGEEKDAIEAVSRFVAGLLTERIVLGLTNFRVMKPFLRFLNLTWQDRVSVWV